MKTPCRLSALVLSACLAVPAWADSGKIIASFGEVNSADAWTSVNDGVMGGVSKGACVRTEAGTLRFSGELSLANNGGFSSIRSKPRPLGLDGATALTVKAKGDGRTYWVELRVTGQMGASSYRADLPTTAGEWREITVPVKDFRFQAFGRNLPAPAIDLAKVDSIGFTLADKKAGPFKLEIESVKSTAAKASPAKASPAKASPAKAGAAGTIAEVAQKAGDFKTLLAAVNAAGLAEALSAKGPLTVFAPTDDAFAKLPKGTVENLLKPANREQLVSILKYHLISGRVTLAKALEAGEGATLQGTKLTAKFGDGRVKIGSANLLQADLDASNGIIHVIDQVLQPPQTASQPLAVAAFIELAIERGVPLFNEGEAAACAAVYEVACEALRSMPGVSERSRAHLGRALAEARGQADAKEKAWVLRKALERAHERLDRR